MTPSIPPPGAHGGDSARLAHALGTDIGAILDLSASFNPAAPDAGQIAGKHLDAVSHYPDDSQATSSLAGAIDVDPDRVVLTNGGAEAIALVSGEIGGHVDEPDFSLYPRGGGPRWRSNPHNPSGLLAQPTEHAGVWDEAFFPLATGRWTRGDADAGAVVVGSLTKVFACPGLRAGYVLAPDAGFAARIRRRQPAWSLNGMAAASIPDFLAIADLPEWTKLIAQWRSGLVDLLRASGLDPQPSDANYVVVRAPGLRARLAARRVLIRDCASFGLPDHVRIAVPDPEGLQRLGSALEVAA